MIPVPNNTAPKDDSVWKELGEDNFRKTIVGLAAASKDIPGDVREYSMEEWERNHPLHHTNQYRLSLRDEQRLANDLAYIAASREGGIAVSAVALEENLQPPGLTIRLAANRSIPEQVPEQLNALLGLLRAQISERTCLTNVFEIVVKLDRERIHSRLRCKHWKKPHRPGLREVPLHKDLLTLGPDFRKRAELRQYHQHLQSLCDIYRTVDEHFESQAEHDQRLRKAVKSSSDFCTAVSGLPAQWSHDKGSLYGPPPHSKHMDQIRKLGRYWDLCIFLTKAVNRYSDLFKNTKLAVERHYIPTQVLDLVTGKPVRYYVHAEIQLIAFYGTETRLESQMPRVLGVSKSACYLCNLFISLHGQFFISKTHGRLYDQWTVPDLEAFSAGQRQQYRSILQKIYLTCKSDILRSVKTGRPYPPESTYDIHAHLPLSPIAASTVSVVSSQRMIRGFFSALPSQNIIDVPNEDAADHVEQIRAASESAGHLLGSVLVAPQCPEDDETEQGSPINNDQTLEKTQNEACETPIPSVLHTMKPDTVDTPLQLRITPLKPCYQEIQGLRIYFEIEEPRRGFISVASAWGGSEASAEILDVHAMAPGEVVDLYAHDMPSTVNARLSGEGGQHLNIGFRWVAN